MRPGRYSACKEGGSVALAGEVQPVEPRGPPVGDVALDPDLVSADALRVSLRCLCVAHDRTLGADLMSADHHM